ncbi:lactadherin [Nematostella vectensis]|uniref:lactadherin n=1 Tax=Nematostella vectensis TaxID=45351 RepID=UPI0020772033|nr:lactadherin [Nematostella vectensis]
MTCCHVIGLLASGLLIINIDALCRNVHSITDRTLSGHVIKTLPDKSLENCITACERESHCYSVNYLSITKTCQLNNKTLKWYPGDVVISPGAVHLGSLARDYDPCVDREPACDGTCLAWAGTLETTCLCNHGNTSLCQSSACIPSALGMQSGDVLTSQIIVSSNSAQKDWGRLNFENAKAWTPQTDNLRQWFQVTFAPHQKVFTKIATRGGAPFFWWVKRYEINFKVEENRAWVSYNLDGKPVVFQGNRDMSSVAYNKFLRPFKATTIRLLPRLWSGRIALRVELYGC